MKEQIGILGVGQCGGNIVSLFEQKGYECAYVNTSMEDLNSLKNAKYKMHVKGGEGASKNRKAVLQLAAESIDNIIGRINELLPQKYLVVCFSAGGGTGSGLSPFLCSYLAQTGRVVIPVVVLPDHEKESVKTCENAYNCCKDLSTAQGLGTMFLLDNGKDDKFIINSQFVREFDAMINMTTISSYGNVDISEIKTMLSTSGIAIISKLSKAKSFASQILHSFKDNIYVDIESKTPTYMGISTCNKSLDVSDITKEFQTSLYDTFYGVAENRTVTVLCGMNWPMERLTMYKDRVDMLSLPKISDNLFESLAPKVSTNTVNTTKEKVIDSRSLLMNFLNN